MFHVLQIHSDNALMYEQQLENLQLSSRAAAEIELFNLMFFIFSGVAFCFPIYVPFSEEI